MPRVLRLPSAKADLLDIWTYIAQDDIDRADTFLRLLEEHFEVLAVQPEIGRERLELGPIRSSLVRRYLVYYRIHAEGIEIVRVLHSARDVMRLFQ